MEHEKIYIKNSDAVEKPSDLISMLYELHVHGGTDRAITPTYRDPECTRQQCGRAYRSFSDVLALVNTYFPGYTEEELMRDIVELASRDNDLPFGLTFMFCPDIEKPVMYKGDKKSMYYVPVIGDHRSHANYDVVGEDGYSMEKLSYLI